MKIKDISIKKPRIEMMPLIDSFFLILVYFIYAFLSMSVHRGVPLTLPQASTAVQRKSEHVGISITKQGEIFLNKKHITLGQLEKNLKIVKSTMPDFYLYIYGDKDASHGNVITVLNIVRKMGIEKVFIETEKGNDDQ